MRPSLPPPEKRALPRTFVPFPGDELWQGWRATATRERLAHEALLNLDEPAERDNPENTPPATVHNVVSTSLVMGKNMPIDLHRLSVFLPCSNYNRKRFAAITIRVHDPLFTSLLFTSGKLVTTGLKSWYECLLASLSMARIINDTTSEGSQFYIVTCEIQNIVAHSEIPMPRSKKLDIQQIYQDYSMECTYSKSMFPGLIYRGRDCPVVLLCFYSGKVVLTGGKKVSDIYDGWDQLWKMVRRYVR